MVARETDKKLLERSVTLVRSSRSSVVYEKKILVLSTNLALRDWPTIFPNATCATALIDTVIHHADLIA